jgi:hypothetical protein
MDLGEIRREGVDRIRVDREGRNVYRVLVGRPKEKDRLKDQGVDGIKMDLREIGWGVWSGFTWLRIGSVGGLL